MAAERGGPGGGRGPGRPTTVFVPDEKGQPKAVDVRIGVSDGQFVELREGLETILGTPVDIVSLRAVRNRYLRMELEETRQQVCAAA